MSQRLTWFDHTFLVIGLLTQIIAYIWMPGHVISLVSGILGICSVILGSQGNILTFLFGFGQIGTYTYLCYMERFYGGIALNIFYFISQIYGIYIWHKRIVHIGKTSSLQEEVKTALPTRRLSTKTLLLITSLSLVVSLLVGYLLKHYTNDTQPYLDAFTTIPAIVAQILMVLAYREQWHLWLAIDLIYICMWLQAGNYCMVMQYAFWCINCIYGYRKWSKLSEPQG